MAINPLERWEKAARAASFLRRAADARTTTQAAPADLSPDKSPKWTPGPWAWSGDRGLFAIYADGRPYGSRASVLRAAIRGQQCQSDDVYIYVRKADADLIAAAPELYEALRAQVSVSEQMMRHAKFTEEDIENCTAQARAALAKAVSAS